MDTFSHALWGYGLFGQKGRPWWALLFGSLPDLMSFGILIAIRVIAGAFNFSPPEMHTIPAWVLLNYSVGHSILIAGACTTMILYLRRDFGFAMLAWPFHILLDFPFHSHEFFPTKLFWPISEWSFDGISWGNPWVWFPNVAGLLILLAYRWRQRNRRRIVSSVRSND
jgi:hypothetical protein